MSLRRHTVIGVAMVFAAVTSAGSSAQEIETLVMPGEVIAGHADLEEECSSCHKMFDKGAQRELCMDCHEDVASDVQSAAGYHGLHPDASDVQCASCHTDHEGRDADIVVIVESDFDHTVTDFELLGKHLENECEDCHVGGDKHRDAPGECVACHEDDEPHNGTMGNDCATCHEETEWQNVEFDHSTTDYTLIGKHLEADCLGCHEDHTFQAAPTECYACHAEDDAHDGRSGQQCESCHNPTDWHDSSFEHSRDTDFPLEGTHSTLACGDCHSEDPFEDDMDKSCVSCHLDDDHHNGNNGEQCDSCHQPTEWTKPHFDHDVETDYRILGAHREVECVDCHVDPVFEVQLGTDCGSCHLDDDPHEGTASMACEGCHTEVNWQDPVYFDHDLTRFPLHGMHTENECDSCHVNKAFAETDRDCVACHLDDDPHRGNFQESCEACHNPVAWDIWTFDHDVQTGFPLQGAHVDVACDACHRSSLEKMTLLDGTCRDCHRADDPHDGEFGPDCGRCHTSQSFKEVRSLQ